jgi:hypothetical protein
MKECVKIKCEKAFHPRWRSVKNSLEQNPKRHWQAVDGAEPEAATAAAVSSEAAVVAAGEPAVVSAHVTFNSFQDLLHKGLPVRFDMIW